MSDNRPTASAFYWVKWLALAIAALLIGVPILVMGIMAAIVSPVLFYMWIFS